MLPTRIYRIIRLHIEGHRAADISRMCPGYDEATIRRILKTPEVRRLIYKLRNNTFTSVRMVSAMLQLAAPEIVREKINLALNSPDELIRTRNTKELLEMAGHAAKQHVVLETADAIQDKYKNMTTEMIRDELNKAIGLLPPSDTVH